MLEVYREAIDALSLPNLTDINFAHFYNTSDRICHGLDAFDRDGHPVRNTP